MNTQEVNTVLNKIIEYELAGVVRYSLCLMVTGPYRLPIVEFLKEQANESSCMLSKPVNYLRSRWTSQSKIAKIEETNDHSIQGILEESLGHELHALNLYKELLSIVEGKSVYLEEYTRGLIGEEEQHQLELRKCLKILVKYIYRLLGDLCLPNTNDLFEDALFSFRKLFPPKFYEEYFISFFIRF